jgi:hypothetical protein
MTESGLTRWLGLETDKNGELVISVRSLYKSLGGALGLLESAIPPLSFSLSFTLTKSVATSVSIAGSLTLVTLAIQVFRRRPVMNAIASVFGIGVAAWLALNGGASDFFLKDFWINALWATGLAISLMVRYPVFGFLLQSVGEIEDGWRKDKTIFRRMSLLTALWVALYVIRLAVQLPLYFADNIAALGVAKFLLGLPLFALWCFFTWLILRNANRLKL